MSASTIHLYHGSNVAIDQPMVSFNTGFADLGKGFYLTPDREAARGRAVSRARREGGAAVVSVYELDEGCVPWLSWGECASLQEGSQPQQEGLQPQQEGTRLHSPFGLYFDETPQGYADWAAYICACRRGRTEAPGMGNPAIVRAWIATMEIEMVHSGFITPEEFAQVVEPAELVVQYCLLDQEVLDKALRFVEAETL